MLLMVSAIAATSPLRFSPPSGFFSGPPSRPPSPTLTIRGRCSGRLAAMKFTGVGQILPGTSDAGNLPPVPPSLPSRADLARATRRHFAANALAVPMVLMVFFSSRIAPFTSTVILRAQVALRPPRWVPSANVADLFVRLAASRLTLSVRSFQVRRRGHHGLAADRPRCPPPAPRGHFGGE